MIYKITSIDMLQNCYIISKNNKCIIIDPGCEVKDITNYIKSNSLKIVGVLLTHGHFDHCKACKDLQDLGIKIYIHKLDEDKLYTNHNLSNYFNVDFNQLKADFVFEEGNISIDEFNIKIIHTPGHSKGSCCFLYENNLFCGDTIFENGVGRTDFYDGSSFDLKRSIKKLEPYLDKKYKLFYGH